MTESEKIDYLETLLIIAGNQLQTAKKLIMEVMDIGLDEYWMTTEEGKSLIKEMQHFLMTYKPIYDYDVKREDNEKT